MRVLQINIFGNLSTGRISVDLHRILVADGHESIIAFARNDVPVDVPHIRIGTHLDVKIHGVMTRITDKTGFYSTRATKEFLKKVDEYNPDIIHLHNIHGYYINIEILFNYLKKRNKIVVWTLHDCWAFTGHCAYFDRVGCNRWKTGCYDCPQKSEYPASKLLDNSKWNYNKKKELFNGVNNMTLITPSYWLADLVKESFLQNYPIKVINNGTDLDVFKPTQSDFRKRYGIESKFIVLGVASTWDTRKGLNDFVKLSQMLDNHYKVVVVGVNEKEKASLPYNMIGILRTNSVQELAGIYSTADVFFNASVEETFGLPTVEGLACGTPVIVYDATALPEVVNDNCGFIVEKNNLESVKNKIIFIKENNINKELCISQAKRFDKQVRFSEYLMLYKHLLLK